jgi:hypothetical protein
MAASIPQSKIGWQEHQDGWIPLGIAIFRFGIADAEAFATREAPSATAHLFSIEAFEQSRERDSKVGYEPAPPTLEHLTKLLTEQAGASKAEIDREEGLFQFWFTLPGGGAARQGGAPWAILWEPYPSVKLDPRIQTLLNTSSLISDLEAPYAGFAKIGDDEAAEGDRQSEAVRLATSLVWRRVILPAFDRAVKAGQVELYARWPLTGDDFRRLPSDIWPLLDVANWEHGVAHDIQGTIYTSIHVAATPSSQSSEDDSGEPMSPALHQQIRAVVKELWPSGEMPPRTKDRDAAVRDWFSEKDQTAPSDRTIRRALTEQK